MLRFLRSELDCDRLFTVPGEAFLPLLGRAWEAGLRLVTVRHEAGAGFAALADARLTGRAGVLAVNRSPGAANAAIALDAAVADPTPLLLIVGGAERGCDPRTGFQATDIEAFLGGIVPVVTVTDAGELADALQRCAEELRAPVPGPVVLVVPEDLWEEPAAQATGAGLVQGVPEAHTGSERPGSDALSDRGQRLQRRAAARVREELLTAQRPVLLAGRLLRCGAGADAEPGALLARFAEAACLPVLLGNKQQDLLNNHASHYAGHLHLGSPKATRDRLAQADLVIVLGDRADDIHLHGPRIDNQRILTVHPAPAGPGEMLTADAVPVLRELARAPWPTAPAGRQEWVGGWRALETGLREVVPQPRDDGVDFAEVATALGRRLPENAVLTLDAGNFSSWVHRYIALGAGQRLLALSGGSMGFGVPAAVAAALRHPDRTVVAVVGDGGLLMTGNELATARAEGRMPAVIVADNGSYGTIRAHQARAFPGRDCGTDLANPDLVRWAESFGLPAERVEAPHQVDPAVRRALASRGGYLLHVRTSLQAVHANFDLPSRR
ncbi:hypothetical protein G3I77_35370 [Streptomyces sp. D2-8]|nr:hypothetical protein [Streptomyces sp. D2-8]